MPFLRGARRMATGLAPRLPSRASREGLPRVRVYLSKEKSRPQRATFPQSIAGHFCAAEEDSWMVNCGLDQHRFLISDREFPGSNRVLLQRPSFCPIKHLSEAQVACLPLETRERGVDVGVAILLQSANQKVLLTRRSKHLNIFPNIWVPPGGHIEPDEQHHGTAAWLSQDRCDSNHDVPQLCSSTGRRRGKGQHRDKVCLAALAGHFGRTSSVKAASLQLQGRRASWQVGQDLDPTTGVKPCLGKGRPASLCLHFSSLPFCVCVWGGFSHTLLGETCAFIFVMQWPRSNKAELLFYS
ncbi:nucleoside diphosphate-linked moiety X motif 17 isoform X3 [Rhineura floridana]|uniref:nucleoside diphosphate-linked moiety X motif 17 isoform X3 n=1 Tax=Rhineura floridana TaxID=261503 RepID=UPI002AC865FE|nr:nucleoside diphosphate-linked moiety X motif 17 isoform X3 [Rhineura floridana]